MTVRLGIIGVGGMGTIHAKAIQKEALDAELVAVCDIRQERLDLFPDLKRYKDSRDLIRSGEVEAVLIATPHYYHTTIGIDALEQGLHVLVEKPISVHKNDALRLIAAHKEKSQVFAAMFNQRTDPHYIRIKRIIDSGELGQIQRTSWIITSWFRSEAYYASGDWRATWAGEGGGVLLNQCPHQLDLFQWLCGMPNKVRAFGTLGKYHDIEVEDEITAYLEYPCGATGMFVSSTGEAPGTNRLEIAGDRGRIVVENQNVSFTRNEVPTSVFTATTQTRFNRPEVWECNIPANGWGEQHLGIIKNFIAAIETGEPLVAPAEQGLHSVVLGNAMLYSALKDVTVEFPLDGDAYEAMLQELIKTSRYEKKLDAGAADDLAGSFR